MTFSSNILTYGAFSLFSLFSFASIRCLVSLCDFRLRERHICYYHAALFSFTWTWLMLCSFIFVCRAIFFFFLGILYDILYIYWKYIWLGLIVWLRTYCLHLIDDGNIKIFFCYTAGTRRLRCLVPYDYCCRNHRGCIWRDTQFDLGQRIFFVSIHHRPFNVCIIISYELCINIVFFLSVWFFNTVIRYSMKFIAFSFPHHA